MSEKIMHLTLDISESVMTEHLEPFYQKNKVDDETLERFILRAVASQAINASAQHDCSVLREAMEKDLDRHAQERMKKAEAAANTLFGK